MDIASESYHHTSEADSLVLTDEHIKKIIWGPIGTFVDFYNGLSDYDKSKLRDSHVIDFLLSNPDHVDKQKVTAIPQIL